RAALARIGNYPNGPGRVVLNRAIGHLSIVPNDLRYTYQGNVDATSQPGTSLATAHQQLNLPAAWDYLPGIAYVAVLDSGIDAQDNTVCSNNSCDSWWSPHPDFVGINERWDRNLRPHLSWNVAGINGAFQEQSIQQENTTRQQAGAHGHGTHVAGI